MTYVADNLKPRSRPWTVGVDFGGTNIKLGLVTPQGRVVHARMLDSRPLRRPAAFVEGVAHAVESLAREAGTPVSRVCGIGVGAPGPVDVRRGLVYSMVNVPGWHRVPLGRLLERRLRRPCRVDNDVNVFTLGECRFGAARGYRQVIGLTLGTGLRAGAAGAGALSSW